ncbi:MAG: sortase [Chloroflexi bacterium]|nr:MAG: sortase [Chloroflexota bacterium]
MSARTQQPNEESVIPLSVVFVSVGLILVLTVATIWLLAPKTMPAQLHRIVGPYLPVTGETAVIPTRAAPATPPQAPQTTAQPIILPETVEGEITPIDIPTADQPAPPPQGTEPSRILIPAINLDAPVGAVGLQPFISDGVTYYQWQVPDEYKAGWHNTSARLGEPGNTVLNGHHNIYGEVFRDLIDLEPGDTIFLFDAQQKQFTYRVTEKQILEERGQPLSVRLENAKWIAPTEDERVTLVTCWPYTDNSHRLVIVAHPVTGTDS